MTPTDPHSSQSAPQNQLSKPNNKPKWTEVVIAGTAVVTTCIAVAELRSQSIFSRIPQETAKAPQAVTISESHLSSFTPASMGIASAKEFAPQFLPLTPIWVPLPSDEPLFNLAHDPPPSQRKLDTPEAIIQEYYHRLNTFLQKDIEQRRVAQADFLQSLAEVREPLPTWNFDDEWWTSRTGVTLKSDIQLLTDPSAQITGYESRYGICLQWSTVNSTQLDESWIVIFNLKEQSGKILGLRAQGNPEWCDR